jgi:hypothetical protein
VTGLSHPTGLLVDSSTGTVFWVNDDGTIRAAPVP